ncbi:MAG: teichoic acid biosynthesis protein [uncultured bacterium]|uniref:Glycosyl transferase n=1 Tax=candidate division WWE3 bacterium RBG_16_37_10 TaxID=1802610 RepID=A0A1F4UX28_UNCKA|nr:MAG: teichoic acid biosynthesis protein [uncultured bacterium]OGC49494.1 MAG: hypothetical protein A2W32_00655 [candidate division WWE3 bacterium RBG_16_37_10]
MTNILNIKIDIEKTRGNIIVMVDKLLMDGKSHIICTTNPEFIIYAQDDDEFMSIINNSDISVPDGYGVILAYNYIDRVRSVEKGGLRNVKLFFTGLGVFFDSVLNRNIVGECIKGVDLFFDISSFAERNAKSIFLLGGWPKDIFGRNVNTDIDLASEAASRLKLKYKNLKIIGATSKYSYKESDDQKTLDYIKSCMKNNNVDHIDFLFVAYGHPKQEKWINRNAHKIPARISMGVGGTFDYIVYPKKRAPNIFIKYKLEWLYRLIIQPWRFKRIINALPIFPIKVYLSSLKSK